MDQGSYSRPDGRGQPTLSGSLAGNNNYQVNVSRQKTKKWVEAKSQNYDGDDWGADEYSEDEIEPPLPFSPHGPQHDASRSASSVPPLHSETSPASQPSQPPQQLRPYPPPSSRPPPPAIAQARQAPNTSSSAQPGSTLPQTAGVSQPQSASSTLPLSPRSPPDNLSSATPQAATTSKPVPLVRPSDIYRRMEEEKGRGSSESSRPSAEIASNVSKQSSNSPARAVAEPVRTQSPNVPAPAPRTDSRNVIYQDLTRPSSSRASQQPLAPSPPQSAAPPSQFVTPGRDAPTNEETKRLSTSPKLPDLARISVFGADFFSTGFSSLSSEQMAEQKIPEVPQVAPALKVDKPTSEAKRSPAVASQASTDKTEVVPVPSVAMENASVQHEAIAPTPHQASAVAVENPKSKPITTPAGPKPSDPAKQSAARSSIETASSSHSATSAVDITPTKPLNVRKDDSPVRSFEPPPPLQREPTFGTDTSSPVKESDVLRDEIFKTLNSPTQPSRRDSETGPVDDERQGSQSRPRDSTYTLQDYDSYWADDATALESSTQPLGSMGIVPEETSEVVAAPRSRGPVANASESWKLTEEAKPAVTQPLTQPAASAQLMPEVSIDQPSSSPAVSQAYQSTAAQQLPDDSIASPTSADLRRRFSWEAETSKAQPTGEGVAPTAATAPPPVLAPTPISDPAPAPALAATTSPHTDPKLGPEPATRDQQSGASAINVSTPAFVATDGSSQESKRLSLSDEKAISATTSNEASYEEHPALRLSDPAPVPVLSMPRIPGASVTPFRDIVSLGSSAERIAKFNETRVAFAVMDIGLDKWLRTLDQDYPDRHSKSFNSHQPPITSPTEVPSGAQPPAQQPYYQQYLNASTPGSGPPAGRRIGGITMPSNVSGSTFGHSGNQIGTKSKELMHSAGKMGKGLFSKGKNKLRGDKGDTHPPPTQSKAKHDRSGSWAVLSSKLRTEFSSSRDHEHSQQRPQQRQEENSVPRSSITIAPQIPEPEPVSPLLREASPDKSLPAAQTSTQPVVHNQFAVGAKFAPTSSTPSVLPSGRIRIVPSETVLDPTSAGAPVMSPPVAEDTGVGKLARTDESDDAPKRQSSFVGLPPIRRSSTFGVKSKTRRAAERFPLDVEGGHDVPDLLATGVMKNALSQQDAPKQLYQEQPGAPKPGAASQTTDKDGTTVQRRSGSAEHSPQSLARQPVMAPPSQPQPMRQPEHPPMLLYPGQSGPWRLEESHLAEPLHQAKNRSGHSPISPPMNYGFDKETGHSAMMPPPPLPAGIIRQRSADVPPSSAQRYPSLFAPHPDQEPLRSSQSYYEEMANPRRSSNEYSIPGVGPPVEERGRVKRNSGMFREIGDKIVRATSRDRRNSIAENRPPTDAHADEASESSFGAEEMQDRKKRRSSFLNMLTGRASMDQGSHQGFSAPQRSQTDALPLSASEGLAAQKRSVLGGVVAGFGVSKDGSSNTPVSGLVDQSAVADDEIPLTPRKKRFSGIARAFQRPSQDRPSSGMSLRPSSGLSLRPSSGMSLEPTPSGGSSPGNTRSGIFSSMPFRNKDHGDSAGQIASANPEQNRRASFSNLLSSLAGIKSHQTEQQHAVPVQGMGGNASKEMPQNIPPAPHQIHPADGFPSSAGNAPAPTLPNQFVDPPQQLFNAGENEWGIGRPPTSTTVTASEITPDAGESIASSAATVPATVPVVSELPLPAAHASTQRGEASAPSEISDSETDIAENTRNPPDVTPSIASHTDEESAEITRQDTNVSQMTSSIVTDVPRQDEQQKTPTAQDPKSRGGCLEHNKMSGTAVPSTVPQVFSQQDTVQHQRDPSHLSTGPSYSQGNHGLDTVQSMQYPKHQQQQKHLQPSLAQPVPQAERAGASPKGWRGLRTKVAGQMASINQSPNSKGQDKQDQGGKTTSMDKLFGARKRLSKQQGLSGAQQQRALPHDGAGGGEPSPGFRVFARNQGPPFVAQPQQLPPQQMHMGQGHQVQQPSLQQQSLYTQQQQPPYQQQPQGEPQYAAVPIPQGYTAVYGQGSAQVPTMYNVGRQYPQHQTPYQQQQNYATHYQPHSYAGVNQPQGSGVFATQTQSPHLPRAELLPRQSHSQQPYATGSEVLSPVSTQHSDGMPLSPASDEPRSPHAALTREALAQQDARKDLQADLLRPEESHGGLGPSNSNRVSQISNDSRRHSSPKSEQSPVISHKQLPTLPASLSNDRHVSAPSMSPPVGSGSDTVCLSHDAARTEATFPTAPAAPLVKDLTGESRGQVSDDALEPKTKLNKTNSATISAATEHVAELEDTAEARKRTLRINEQEEKIAYDPEEENPKMMATSYPGQEWKPDYGDPGFSDGPE
ncbi:hypothetical protein G3M48_005732 [Beauveria asiatica]|uniref:SWI-SNF chromatin-remodeling complex protein n=1 Tax=Beauveria asiatica TaxID=1069075 RepID=A0AAW0RQK7_9HYPO